MRLPNTLRYYCQSPTMKFMRDEGAKLGYFNTLPQQFYQYNKADLEKLRDLMDEIIKDWRD